MKKLMISMAVAMLATFSYANATNTVKYNPAASIAVNQDKVEVKPEDLPEAVKATLAAAPYNEWKVEKAFLVPGEEGEDTAIVKLDGEGKVVE
jgi:hypothetical protein